MFRRLTNAGGIPFGESCLLPSRSSLEALIACQLDITLSAGTLIIQTSLTPSIYRPAREVGDDHVLMAPYCTPATIDHSDPSQSKDCSDILATLGLPNFARADRTITLQLDDSITMEYPLALCFVRQNLAVNDCRDNGLLLRGIVQELSNDFWNWKDPTRSLLEKLKPAVSNHTESIASSPKDTKRPKASRKASKTEMSTPKLPNTPTSAPPDSKITNGVSESKEETAADVAEASMRDVESSGNNYVDLDSMLMMDSTSPGMMDLNGISHDESPPKPTHTNLSRQMSSGGGESGWDVFDLDNPEVTEDDFSFFDDVPKRSALPPPPMDDLGMDTSMAALDDLSFGIDSSTAMSSAMDAGPTLAATDPLADLDAQAMMAADIADVLEASKTPGHSISTHTPGRTPGYPGATPSSLQKSPQTPKDQDVNEDGPIMTSPEVKSEVIQIADIYDEGGVFDHESPPEGVPNYFTAVNFPQSLICSDDKYASGKFICNGNNGSHIAQQGEGNRTVFYAKIHPHAGEPNGSLTYYASWRPSDLIKRRLVGQKRKRDAFTSKVDSPQSPSQIVKIPFNFGADDVQMKVDDSDVASVTDDGGGDAMDTDDEHDWYIAEEAPNGRTIKRALPVSTYATFQGCIGNHLTAEHKPKIYAPLSSGTVSMSWNGGGLQQDTSGQTEYVSRGPFHWRQDHPTMQRKAALDALISQIVDAPYPLGINTILRTYDSSSHSHTIKTSLLHSQVTEHIRLFKTTLHDVFGKLISPTNSTFSSSVPSTIVHGPMALGQLLELNQAPPPQSKYGKYQVRKRRSSASPLQRLQPPYMTIRRLHHDQSDLHEMMPSACRFWEKMGFDPLSGAKAVEAYTVFPRPDQTQVEALPSQVTDWLASVKATYEAFGFGQHTNGGLGDFKQGMVPVNLLPPVQSESITMQRLSSFESMCSRLGTLLATRPPSQIHTVIYILTPFTHETAFYDICRCFVRLRQAYQAAIKKSKAGREQAAVAASSRIVLQIVPLPHVIQSNAFNVSAEVLIRSIALSVYQRCRLRKESRLLRSRRQDTELDFAPAIAISRPPPNRINYALRTPPPPPPLLDQNLILHVGYQLSADERYLCVTWMDERGRDVFRAEAVALYLAGRRRMLRDVIEEMWDHTKVVMARAVPEWDVVVAKLGQYEVEEVQTWISVASYASVAPTPHASQSTPAPESQTAQFSRLSFVCVDFSNPLITFQSTTRPQTSTNGMSGPTSYQAGDSEGPDARSQANLSLDGSVDVMVEDDTSKIWSMVLSHKMILGPGSGAFWSSGGGEDSVEQQSTAQKRLLSVASGIMTEELDTSPTAQSHGYYVHLVHVMVQGDQPRPAPPSSAAGLAVATPGAAGPATVIATPGGALLHSPVNTTAPAIILRDIMKQFNSLSVLGDAYQAIGSGIDFEPGDPNEHAMRLPLHLELSGRLSRFISYVVTP